MRGDFDEDEDPDFEPEYKAAVTGKLIAGEVIALGARYVQVVIMPDGTICRDYRKRVAVRNVASRRLYYVPEWQLLKAKRVQE